MSHIILAHFKQMAIKITMSASLKSKQTLSFLSAFNQIMKAILLTGNSLEMPVHWNCILVQNSICVIQLRQIIVNSVM